MTHPEPMPRPDPLATLSTFNTASGPIEFYSLPALARILGVEFDRMPHTVKILLENMLRRFSLNEDGIDTSLKDVASLAGWPQAAADARVAYMPSRILMQDFTGVPAVVDLAALRTAVFEAGGDPKSVNPFIPVDLVIDHSVQVDRFGGPDAYRANLDWEYKRNHERYSLLNWAQQAFSGFRVVPPGMGICHQVNLEYLSSVVAQKDGIAFPETLVGTDSHTTMINGLGILGWGVGGIEAEAAMLGQPMFLPPPYVVGVEVVGALPAGTTATDLVLTLTEMLRAHGVVGQFVEFFGPGLSGLRVADRATIANMSPEFGATATLFPVDDATLNYLKSTGRTGLVDLVQRYCAEQGLFRRDGDQSPQFSETLQVDLSAIQPCLAGPSRPQDRVTLGQVKDSFFAAVKGWSPNPTHKEVDRLEAEGGPPADKEQPAPESLPPDHFDHSRGVADGSVVIAAITSCTNTSNPSVMIAAGLLAKHAVEAGLSCPPWVKTSLAPGSRVVSAYLEKADLTTYLDKLGFNVVGYGCTTCIGNSGPLDPDVAKAVEDDDLAVVAVLSGNRNFEGRIHPQVKASYLASPPLCVAYALAGRIDVDLTTQPLGRTHDGRPCYLSDLWPSSEQIESVMAQALSSDQYDKEYSSVFGGNEQWKTMLAPSGTLYEWDDASTYIREPPYFKPGPSGDGAGGDSATSRPRADITAARALVVLGDSITTDHISPAGSIKANSAAGEYLLAQGVPAEHFNSFGARRGNHEVMLRGTFGNARLKNMLAPGKQGAWTAHLPDGEVMSIYDAALKYAQESTPLIAIAGKDYGSGSSRDWAAKGTALLGIRAVIAMSYERIHRSNLIGMGVLPLQFAPGDSPSSLGIEGDELFTLGGLGNLSPADTVSVRASRPDGRRVEFEATVRIDTPAELQYWTEGGILVKVLRQLLESQTPAGN